MNTGEASKNTTLLAPGFISLIWLILVFIFSAAAAYGAASETWRNMFYDVRAYESAMRASGVHNFNIIQDAKDMQADEIAYDRDAYAFIDDYLNRKGSRDAYIIERDFSAFHDTRVRELEQKWRRSPFLVECATKMAVSVRDSYIAQMKTVVATDPRNTMPVLKADDASTSIFYSSTEEKEVISLLERATVFVVAVDTTKNTANTGSGFFVAPGVILTNRHVIDDKNRNILIFSKVLRRPAQASVIGISDRKERDSRCFAWTGSFPDFPLISRSTPKQSPPIKSPPGDTHFPPSRMTRNFKP